MPPSLSSPPSRMNSIVDAIGNTPLVRLRTVEKQVDAPAGTPIEIYAKCEFRNPGGSVKDRPARQMVLDALARGALEPGGTLIDATSGNTGVAFSLLGAALGFRVVLVMPENVTEARKRIANAYGTEIVYSSPMEGSDGAIRLVRHLVESEPGRYFYADQYSNPSNPAAHYRTTAPELWAQTEGRITHFVAGIGTSGTVMGTGRRLHELNPNVRVVAVEPDDALHGLEGLKHMASSIVPDIWRPQDAVDEIMPMPTDEGWDMAERIYEDEGLFVGHSAGGAVAGALRLARQCAAEKRPAVIVALLPDGGTRYLPAEAKDPPRMF